MKPKLSNWYPPEIKPVHEGAYWITHDVWERDHFFDGFAYWDGRRWSDSVSCGMHGAPTKEQCDFDSPGIFQDKIWRGLARKPK